jgi:prepilin-type N-terminal cleavage/methylation domain-containing protein
MRKPSLREKGFTLIEVMVSTGLLTILVGSMMALLSDYSQYFQEAQEKSTLMNLRRTIIQNLNRREAWIVTYRAPDNTSFECFRLNTYSQSDCPSAVGGNPFTLYGRTYPPSAKSVVFSTKKPPAYTVFENAPSGGYGLTARGEYCNTFKKDADTAAARRCPFRLDLTWELLTFGIPSTATSYQYYPTGYMPAGYYEGTGSNSYFGPGYFPGADVTSQYWWTGTLAAQVKVRGVFQVNDFLKTKINTKSYDFSIIKEVP